jgi:hypothetical protein
VIATLAASCVLLAFCVNRLEMVLRTICDDVTIWQRGERAMPFTLGSLNLNAVAQVFLVFHVSCKYVTLGFGARL